MTRGLLFRATTTHTPAAQDESRLFHRLPLHWIYYFRHVDPQLINPIERSFVDVRLDEQGQSQHTSSTGSCCLFLPPNASLTHALALMRSFIF